MIGLRRGEPARADRSNGDVKGGICRACSRLDRDQASRTLSGARIATRDDVAQLRELLNRRMSGAPIENDLLALWYLDPADGVPLASDGRQTWLAPAIAIGLVGLLVVAFAIPRSSGTPVGVTDGGGDCIFAAGQLDFGSEESLARYQNSFIEAFDGAGGVSAIGCATGAIRRWQSLVVQDFVFNSQEGGAIVAATPEQALYLEWTAWVNNTSRSLASLATALGYLSP